jgi:2-hydroxychromene-2-carboxylate isomerase
MGWIYHCRMVDFYFDYASPWAYLASELAASRLSGVEIRWRPIYLRGLETFSKGLPYSSNKLRYIGQDFLRCATHENVAVKMPTNFPVNGLYAVRGALAALAGGVFENYHRAMFHAAWRDDRDVGDKAVVNAIVAELGLTLDIEAPAIKEKLKLETAEAEARGVFGVPSFFVGDELFWGHDRMDYVLRAAKGR